MENTMTRLKCFGGIMNDKVLIFDSPPSLVDDKYLHLLHSGFVSVYVIQPEVVDSERNPVALKLYEYQEDGIEREGDWD